MSPLAVAKFGQQRIDTSMSYTTKRKGVWDFRDFGAVGDSTGATGNGVNNDAALAAAKTTIANIGYGILKIPGGIFRYTTGLTIDFDEGLDTMSIEGNGQNNSQLFFDSTTGTAIDWGWLSLLSPGANPKTMNGMLKHFSVLGRGRGNTGTIGIRAARELYWRQERLLVIDFETAFFYDGSKSWCSSSVIDQCRASNNKYGFRTGDSSPGTLSDDNEVTDLLFIKCYANPGVDTGKPANSIGFYLENMNTSCLLHCSAENYDINWKVGTSTSVATPSGKNTFLAPRGEGFDTANFQVIDDDGNGNIVVGIMQVDDQTTNQRTVGVSSWDGGGGLGMPHNLKFFDVGDRPIAGGNNNGGMGFQLGTSGTQGDALWLGHKREDGTYDYQAINVVVVTGHAPTDADYPSGNPGTAALQVGAGSLVFRTDTNQMYVRGTGANVWTALN